MAGEISGTAPIDIFATHEPVAAGQLAHDLPDRIRQTSSGHLHAHNATSAIQNSATINLVEGSTGAGGLDNIGRTGPRPPIEFSIESVAASCQFTKLLWFHLNNAATPTNPSSASFGNDVTVSTHDPKAQRLDQHRRCSTADEARRECAAGSTDLLLGLDNYGSAGVGSMRPLCRIPPVLDLVALSSALR